MVYQLLTGTLDMASAAGNRSARGRKSLDLESVDRQFVNPPVLSRIMRAAVRRSSSAGGTSNRHGLS